MVKMSGKSLLIVCLIVFLLCALPVWSNGQGEKLSILERLLKIETELVPPVGSILPYASASKPTGWLFCDGTALSREQYKDLFDKIGTTYGVGDGRTTFNLPDLRGVFLRGTDSGKGYDPGRQLGSYQQDDNRSHNHNANETGNHNHGGNTNMNGEHDHKFGGNDHHFTIQSSGGSNDKASGIPNVHRWGTFQPAVWVTIAQAGNHQHSINTDGNHRHDISYNGTESRPKNVAVMYIIKY